MEPLTSKFALSRIVEGSLGAASKNLVQGVSRLIGSYFLKGIYLREANADALRMEIDTDSKILSEANKTIALAEQKLFNEMIDRHIQSGEIRAPERYVIEMNRAKISRDALSNARKEENFQKALVGAIEEIENSAKKNCDANIDPDFILDWIEAVEKVSDDQLRKIWAGLLAQHATEEHDGLTPHSIDIVRRLHARLVFIYEKIGPLCWLMGGIERDAVVGTYCSNNEFEELIEIGLIKQLDVAKIRFGNFYMMFFQRDDARKSIHFYGLTQAGRQIFMILSPELYEIFDDRPNDRRVNTGRLKIDFEKRFANTASLFGGSVDAVKFLTKSATCLIDQRKLNMDITSRLTNGSLITLMNIEYDNERGGYQIDIRPDDDFRKSPHADFGLALAHSLLLLNKDCQGAGTPKRSNSRQSNAPAARTTRKPKPSHSRDESLD